MKYMKLKLIRYGSSIALLFLLTFCQSNEAASTGPEMGEAGPEEDNTDKKSSASTPNRFEWQSDLCDHMGYYQPGKFSERQLKDTYFLFYGHNSVTALNTEITLDLPEYYNASYIESSLKKLDNEYLEAVQRLKNLDVIPSPFWKEHKELSLLQLEELYQLQKLTLKAHLNPALLETSNYASGCRDYVNALTSKDTTELLNAWKKHVELKKSNNGVPEKLEQEYQRQLASSDRLLFARIDLMNYGWWNCANRQRKYVDGFDQEGQMTKEFHQLFDRVETVCDE